MKKSLSYLFFVVYSVLLILFVYKIYSETNELSKPSEIEVLKNNYDEPNDLFNDTTLSEKQRSYYQKLYDEK